MTPDQLRDIADALRGGQLHGRPVLVPITRWAFRPGHLQPDTQDEEEIVKIANQNQEAKQVSVKEAIRLLEEERSTLLGRPKKVVEQKQKLSGKKSEAPVATSSSAVYFDIREEYDEDGKQISAERINVAQMLQAATEQIVEAAAPLEDALEIISPVPPNPAISDDEYHKLSQRLEELAMLEEEEESSLRQRTTRKGWNKGFLNAATTTKKKPTTKTNTKVTNTIQSTFVESIPTKASPQVSTTTTESTPRRVGFSDQPDQVKEIPRVGERSTKDFFKSKKSSDDLQVPPPSASIISGTVLSDTVQERPRRGRATAAPQENSAPRASRFKQERQGFL